MTKGESLETSEALNIPYKLMPVKKLPDELQEFG